MKQLSGSDNLVLVKEDKNVYNHVASLTIHDVSTAPGATVRYKGILKPFADRMSIALKVARLGRGAVSRSLGALLKNLRNAAPPWKKS